MPIERAEILRADFAWVAAVIRRIVVGAIIGTLIVKVSRMRPEGFIGNDGASHDACAEPEPY